MLAPRFLFLLVILFLSEICFADFESCRLGRPYIQRSDIASDWLNMRVYRCEGPFVGKRLDNASFAQVLEAHQGWLRDGEVLNDPRRANLCLADLSMLDLNGSDLRRADFTLANLGGTDLSKTKLSGSIFRQANLRYACLTDADLQEVDFRHADLSQANFDNPDLTDVKLFGANLQGAVLEAKPGSLSASGAVLEASKLFGVRYFRSPHSLYELREAFKKAGLRNAEREINYAIQSRKFTTMDWSFASRVESGLNFFAFDLTCKYCMTPTRPLWIVVVLFVVFSVPYAFALYRGNDQIGIWKIWPKDRTLHSVGSDDPIRLTKDNAEPLRTALYFSLLSASNIGWRELNVGSWIARIQAHEYVLRGTGWVRTVAGIQSLITVYLLALWALCYFSRPFE